MFLLRPLCCKNLRLILSVLAACLCVPLTAPAIQTRYIDVAATVAATPSPQVTFTWDTQQSGVSMKISRRVMGTSGGSVTWELRGTAAHPTASFTDPITAGTVYEYKVDRPYVNATYPEASSFVAVTSNAPVVHSRGKLLLVVDQTQAAALAGELALLELDLAGDGWTVQRIDSARHGAGTPAALRTAIQAAYNADPSNLKAVYLFGHLPIPMTGWDAPDGHENRPQYADGFYGDMDGTWTDNSNFGSGNAAGDGVYDQNYFPSKLELMVGRVDFSGMSFHKSETEYLRDYIYKSHAFRQGRRTEVPRNGLWNSSYLWQEHNWILPMFGAANITTATFQPTLSTTPQLFGIDFGIPWGGDGNYTETPNKLIFGINFGSYKLSWGMDNNAMRALLTQPDWGLTCVWGARPAWFFHQMSAGLPVGYSALQTMNNWSGNPDYFPTGDYSFQAGNVQESLMGDPSLRLHPVAPPESVTVAKSGADAVVSWQPSPDAGVSGYYVYSSTSRLGPYALLTATPVAGTTFTDVAPPAGDVFYQVRALKTEVTAPAIYANTSQGAFAKLKTNGTGNHMPSAQGGSITAPGNQQTDVPLSGADPDGDALTPIVLTNPSLGELRWTGGVARYQPKAGTSGSDTIRYVMSDGVTTSAPATITVNSTPAGALKLAAPTLKVSRTAGTAEVGVERAGGSAGAITLSYTVANSSAVAGTHFTAPGGTLSWADGETGIKNISIPITNSGTPQQSRQFRITLNSVTNGASIGVFNSTAVLIEDPAATLPAPWAQTLIKDGNQITMPDSSSAVEAEGALGSVTMGGLGLNTPTVWENGQFIYQSRTGDGVMTAFVPTPTPAQTDARFAVMVRSASSNGGEPMAATVTCAPSNTFGSKFIYRTGQYLNTVVTGSAPTENTPRWIRITRTGNTFTSEYSTDGAAWTTLGSIELTNIPATAQWGLFHLSSAPTLPSGVLPIGYGDYQLATFQNVSFSSVPATPTPGNFALTTPTSTSVKLTWTASAYAAGYRIERRTENSDFILLTDIPSGTTLTYTDNTVSPASAYQYRIVAYNGSGASASSPSLGAATPDPLVTANITAEADATVRYDSPASPLGSGTLFTVAGSDFAINSLTPVAKSWLRFDLSGLPTLVSARLKLAFVAARDVDVLNQYFYGTLYLLSEASDAWDETAINWTNAPQNDIASKGLLPAGSYLSEYYLDTSFDPIPSPGTVIPFDFSASTINSGKGSNGKISIAFVPYEWDASGALDFASRENGILSAPTLEVTYYNPLLRPGFLTVAPAAGSGIDLMWTDNSSNETGFQLERRAANGDWTLVSTIPANSTSYTDSGALPGVIYEYRLRAASAAGNSSWATNSRMQHTAAAAVNNPVWSSDSVVYNQISSPENGCVPAGFMYYPTAPTAFATGQSLYTYRNTSTTWGGMKITVGSTPITVRELARWVIAGSTGTHIVKIVNAATNTEVPGGSVAIDTAGAPAGFKYAALPNPVTLAANASYHIITKENGVDNFYDGNSGLAYSNSVAAIAGSSWSNDGLNCNLSGYAAGTCYGPLNFTYSTTPPAEFTTGHSMTTLRNDSSGWFGMKITVGATDILASQLGRWVAPGNTGTHAVKLVNATTGANVASASVATAAAPAGQFQYAKLASAVTLAADTSYYLLSQETAGGDLWYDFATPSPGTATGYQSWLLANGLPMDGSGAGSATATPANDGLPNLIKYALGLAPGANGNGGRLSSGQVTDAGADYLRFTYTRAEPAPAGITYTVEASTDLTGWTTTGLVQVSSTLNGSLRTITVRDSTPMGGNAKRFMRLGVSQP